MQLPESLPTVPADFRWEDWRVTLIAGGVAVVIAVAGRLPRASRPVRGTRCALCAQEELEATHVADVRGLRAVLRAIVAVLAGLASALLAVFAFVGAGALGRVVDLLVAVYLLIVALAAGAPLHSRAVLRCSRCSATWPRG